MITSITSAGPWWLLSRPEELDGRWRRERLVAWALVADPGIPPYPAALVVDRSGALVEVATEGRFVADHEWMACECESPDVGPIDPSFCRFCGSEVR